MIQFQKISPFLWFDDGAEAAANHYVKGIPNSRIHTIVRSPMDLPSVSKGSVLSVHFELQGHQFTAFNGGPMFKPNESVSFAIACEDQKEVDFLWDYLSDGGSTSACGWLKDRWGFSWQIVPRRMLEILTGKDQAAMARAFAAMLEMTKFDIAAIERAYKG
jgi:predicted 3-demethylubiquinone-9 3-methyltransferase (glyoxalase superfamily)